MEMVPYTARGNVKVQCKDGLYYSMAGEGYEEQLNLPCASLSRPIEQQIMITSAAGLRCFGTSTLEIMKKNNWPEA